MERFDIVELGYGGACDVSPELQLAMCRNSESVAAFLLISKAHDSDCERPIAGSCVRRTGAMDAER